MKKIIHILKKTVPILLAVSFLCMNAALLIIYGEAERASVKASRDADNFEVTRRLVVFNVETNKPQLELVAEFSFFLNAKNELEVVCKTGLGEYKKHYIYISPWTTYLVEELGHASVTPYRYEITYMSNWISD